MLELLPGIPDQVDALKKVLAQKVIPNVDIGPHCSSPYSCDFEGHCWKHSPEYSVFNISRLKEAKKFELYQGNIVNLVDIPKKFPLSEKQWMQVKSELNNQTISDKKKIREFINDLKYPLYFLDFETFSTAIPIFDSSKPYQQLVFQYSLHILQSRNSEVIHKEYLAEVNGNDPRLKFIEQLIADCGKKGDILVYNVAFERGKLYDLANTFPQFAKEINEIIRRLKDLMIPFQKRWYYTPSMQGSYSIKKVLPALVPELSYYDLNIQEGGTASNTFSAMLTGDFQGDVEQTRNDLLDYCKLDTFAMVKILQRPYSGSYINVGEREYLLFNNTWYDETSKPTPREYHFPVKIKLTSTHLELLEEKELVDLLIDQVYQFSRMYWKSVTQQNLPVTLAYPEMVAEIFPYFKYDKLPDYGKENLWFL